MLELNISQNKNTQSPAYGKYFARVEYKKTMGIDDMAKHMAEHNTPFSVGTIAGILKDFVACTREQCLSGNTVKIDNLAIFKCSVESNGLVLEEGAKIVGGLGGVPATKNSDGSARTPDYSKESQYAIKSAKLLAQATGEFTRAELNGDATFRWTKAARDFIDGIVSPNGGGTSGGSTSGSGTQGSGSGSGTTGGGSTSGSGTTTGGGTTGGTTTGGEGGGDGDDGLDKG